MAYSYDRRLAHTPRHRQKGKAKRLSQLYYRQHKQQIRQRSKQWRRKNRSKIRKYQKKRNANPGMYRLRTAAADHSLFNPAEDVSLLDREIEFEDLDSGEIGMVDWIDYDEGEVHAVFLPDEGERFTKTYELYNWMDHVVFLFQPEEDFVLQILDEMHEDAEFGTEDDLAGARGIEPRPTDLESDWLP